MSQYHRYHSYIYLIEGYVRAKSSVNWVWPVKARLRRKSEGRGDDGNVFIRGLGCKPFELREPNAVVLEEYGWNDEISCTGDYHIFYDLTPQKYENWMNSP